MTVQKGGSTWYERNKQRAAKYGRAKERAKRGDTYKGRSWQGGMINISWSRTTMADLKKQLRFAQKRAREGMAIYAAIADTLTAELMSRTVVTARAA